MQDEVDQFSTMATLGSVRRAFALSGDRIKAQSNLDLGLYSPVSDPSFLSFCLL